jgi:hypothetical protein
LAYPRSEYVTVDEAADIKNTTVSVIKRAIFDEVLPAEHPGNIWLVRRAVLAVTPVRQFARPMAARLKEERKRRNKDAQGRPDAPP